MRISTKRIYNPADPRDGTRVLIDRLWPRGIRKEVAKIDYWAKDLAPSTKLRKWYQHEHDKWPAFRNKYWAELDAMPRECFDQINRYLNSGKLTLVFSSKEEALNNAKALKEYLESK